MVLLALGHSFIPEPSGHVVSYACIHNMLADVIRLNMNVT